MSAERYDLYFKGDLLDGYSREVVKVDMARLFKTDVAKIEPFFSGHPQPVKLKVDKATAAKYQKALKAIGARLLVVPAGKQLTTRRSHPPEVTNQAGSAQRAAETQGIKAPAWKILPPGSDMGERQRSPAVSVDTSRLSLARPGAPLNEKPVSPEPKPIDTSALSLAKPGEPLVEKSDRPAPKPIDTSSLSIGAVGDTLAEENRTPPPPPPDTTHLSVD